MSSEWSSFSPGPFARRLDRAGVLAVGTYAFMSQARGPGTLSPPFPRTPGSICSGLSLQWLAPKFTRLFKNQSSWSEKRDA